MKLEVKEKWVAALRSGEYEQGRRYLSRDGKYCCLGVLCDLAVQEGVIPNPLTSSIGFAHVYGDPEKGEDTSVSLPLSVREWAGMNTPEGEYMPEDADSDEMPTYLSTDNDQRGKSFSEIADIIERYHREL